MTQATWPESSGGPRIACPRDLTRSGWLDVLRRVKEQIAADRLSVIAAGVAFYALLAVFPALSALVGLSGLLFDPHQVGRQVSSLGGVVPAEAVKLLMGQLRDLSQSDRTALGLGVAGGLLLALWSSSAGVRTLMKALNVAYDVRERRGFLRRTGLALALTLGVVVGGVVAIGAVVVLPAILHFVGLGDVLRGVVSLARWPIVAALFWLGAAVMYRYGPSRSPPKWLWVTWGASVATVLWLVGSALFSWYVSSFGNYNETYGSIGGVVILLMWFLLSAFSLLIGAELNAELERQAKGSLPAPTRA